MVDFVDKNINSNFVSQFINDYQKVEDCKMSKDEMINDLAQKSIGSENTTKENIVEIKNKILKCKEIKISAENSINDLGTNKDISPEEKIKEIEFFEKVENICVNIEKLYNSELQKSDKELPPFNFILACDIDVEDDNGAIASAALEGLKNGLPVVTTPSVLKNVPNMSYRLDENLSDIMKNYKIFREKEGNLMFFIPSNNENDEIDLKNFGLVKDNFEEIKYEREGEGIFDAKANGKTNIKESFNKLFEMNSNCSKRIAIVGHGKPGIIGGLKAENYRSLLGVINQPQFKCGYLDITSCHGGGDNLLEHYLEGSQLEEKRNISFPILVRSIDDSPTVGKSHFKDLFNQFDEYTKGAPTIQTMGRLQQPSEYTISSSQILFPSKGAQTGFRSIPTRHSPLYDLTFTKMRGHEIQKTAQISVDSQIVGLYPLTIHTPLKITNNAQKILHTVEGNKNHYINDPVLHSAIPGKAHHFLKEIELVNSKLSNLLEGVKDFNISSSSNKAFFIGKVKDSEKEYQNVVISHIDKSTSCLRSYENEKQEIVYERVQGTKNEVISKEEYISELAQILILTKPNEEAVWLSTGGQENTESFIEDLKNNFVDKTTNESLLIDGFSNDSDLMQRALDRDVRAINYIPEKFQEMFAHEIVKKNGLNFKHLSDNLKNNKQIALTAIRQNPFAFLLMSEQLQTDRNILITTASIVPQAMRRFPKEIWKDKEIVFELLKVSGSVLEYAPEDFKKEIRDKLDDDKFMLDLLRKNPLELKYASEKLRNNKEFVSDALKKNGLALEFASEECKNDKELLLIALKQNREAYKFVPMHLQFDDDIMSA